EGGVSGLHPLEPAARGEEIAALTATSGVGTTSISTRSSGVRDTTERTLVVFAKGTDNALWYKFYDSSGAAWSSVGGRLTSAPAAALAPDGRLVVFARGDDNTIWHIFYDGGWSGW